MSHNQHPERKLSFSGQVTLGHIIQMVGGICAAIALYMNMDRRLTAVEIAISYSDKRIAKVENIADKLADNQSAITRVTAKLAQ